MYKYLTAILLLPLFLNSSVLAEILIINVESAYNNGLALVGIYDKEENFGKAKVNKKLLHFVGILHNENHELSAIFETVLAHMDLNARKVSEFKSEKLNNLIDYTKANPLQESLPFELRLKIKDI